MLDRIVQLQFGSEIFDLNSVGLMEGDSLLEGGGGGFSFAPHRLDAVLRSEQSQLTDEKFQMAAWAKHAVDVTAKLSRLWKILRAAWRYTKTSRQRTPVYLVVKPKGRGEAQYALVHSCPQASGASPIGAHTFDGFLRSVQDVGLGITHYPWQDGPPGELPASLLTLVATDGPANPTRGMVANFRDTVEVTHVFNAYDDLSSVTLTPSYDNTMGLLAPGTNYDGLPSVYSGNDDLAGNDTWRMLLKFPIVAGVPAGATIVTATLRMRVTEDHSSNARTFRVYRCLRAWNQTQSCWTNWKAANAWTTGGADSAGNDREAADIGTKSLGAAEVVGTWEEWVLDPTKIEEMLDSVLVDNGFVVRTDTETNDAYAFSSLEGGDPPQLVITYRMAAVTYSGNLFDQTGWTVWAAVPAAFNILYIGNNTPRPWHHWIVNIATAGVYTIDAIKEYWNGAWVAAPDDSKCTLFPTGPEDSVFTRAGDWVVNPGGLFDWATTAINGVTAYWIRIRIVAVTVMTTAPVVGATAPYTQRKPYIEIPATAIGGDTLPHTLLRLYSPYGGDDDEGFPNLSKIIMAAKSEDAADPTLDDFEPFLNWSDEGNPAGWACAVGTDGSFAADTLAPTGRALNVNFAGDASLTVRGTLTGTAKIKPYVGAYRMFLRCRQVGGAAGNVSVAVFTRLLSTSTQSPATKTSTTALGMIDTDDIELVDFGILTLPFGPIKAADDLTNMDLIFQVYAQRSTGAATLRIYDLILMPINEWANAPFDPLADTTYGSSALRGDTLLEMDSGIIHPRLMKMRSQAAGEPQPMETWNDGGPYPQLQPATRYRIWFLLLHFRSGGQWGTGPWAANLGAMIAFEIYARNRYLLLRGEA